MRVALDARSLQRSPLAGVGRVTAGVLPFIDESIELHLLTAAERPPLGGRRPVHPLRTPWPGVSAGWMQWSAPRWLRRDFDGIFHSPWYGLPFIQPVPMVVTLHDLTFERHPEWFPKAGRLSFIVQARWAARTARAVIADSLFVADDIMRTYGVPSERIVVASPGVDDIFRPTRDSSKARSRLGIADNYVVAVGGNPRRNLDLAVAAWRTVRERIDIDLVVVGTDQPPHGEGIHGGRLPDDEWADVLAGAQALLYPTADEGFGLPALEAIASGTPVICARVGSLPEVLGEAAMWCDALSAQAFATMLEELLTNNQHANEIRDAGLATVANRPSWREAAEAHLAAYTLAAS